MRKFLPVPYAFLLYGINCGWHWGGVAVLLTLWVQLLAAVVLAPMHAPSERAWDRECYKRDSDVASLLLIVLTFGQALALCS